MGGGFVPVKWCVRNKGAWQKLTNMKIRGIWNLNLGCWRSFSERSPCLTIWRGGKSFSSILCPNESPDGWGPNFCCMDTCTISFVLTKSKAICNSYSKSTQKLPNFTCNSSRIHEKLFVLFLFVQLSPVYE